MLRAITTCVLCICGGYGAGTVIREGINEKKPWKIVIGLILSPLAIVGGGYAGEHMFDDFVEDEKKEA